MEPDHGAGARPDGAAARSLEQQQRFLRGPRSKGFEFVRAAKIFAELIRGFRAFHRLGPCVTVFGSARFPEGHPYYELGRDAGRRLAEAGFAVLTGGGPGLMESANRGAKEAGGRTVGVNILLPEEQEPNPYVDRTVTFKHFYVRKVMLVKYSYAFVVLPGGYGTLDEVFETATLVQTRKIEHFPIVLIGADYWSPLLSALKDRMLAHGTIDPADFDLLYVTDSAAQAVEHVRDVAMGRFHLTYGPKAKRRWLLTE